MTPTKKINVLEKLQASMDDDVKKKTEWKTVRLCECPECGELVQDMDEACLHKCKNTPEEKINELVEHIELKFPKGCRDIQDCEDCPINKAQHATLENDVCELLANIAYRED